MKAKYIFGRISFIVICGLLVSFSFVREFSIMAGAEETVIHEPIAENMVNVHVLDCDDNLIYETQVDLKDATRKKDDELMNFLKASEYVSKDQHTLYFRLIK